MTRPFYARYGPLILLAFALALPWVVTGVLGALPTPRHDVRDWLPQGFEETRTYQWFLRHFGNDEIAVVSWPGCTLDDGGADRLARALVPDGDAAPGERPRFFQRAITGRQALRLLTAPPLSVPDAEARRRLQGSLVGPDGTTTCVVLFISEAGTLDRPAAVERIYEAAAECGLDRERLRLGGPTVYGAAMDVESVRALRELGLVSLAVGFVAAWIRLRSLRLALIVLAGSLYAGAATVASLHWGGRTLNDTLPVLPPLVYLLTISGGVHLINYYRDAVGTSGLAGAADRAVARGWLPCTLAAGTTAVGLLSLVASKTPPIRTLGLYAAIGMGFSLAVLLLFVPGALQWLPVRRPPPGRSGRHEAGGRTDKALARMASALRRFHAPITGMCVGMMLLLGCALLRLEATIRMRDRFAPRTRVTQDSRWLEENLGPLMPMEVVVRFDRNCPLRFPERLRKIGALQRQINRIDGVGASLSAATFAPAFLERAEPAQAAGGLLHAAALVILRQRLKDTRYIATEGDDELWRITVRTNALKEVDYDRLTEALRRRVDPMLAALGRVPASRPTTGAGSPTRPHNRPTGTRCAWAIYTGTVPLIHGAQRVLMRDLASSFCLAFLVITVVMIAALRSLPAGLLAMLPNLFPTVVVFGAMGWLGQRVNIGSMVTASIALGIAVDGTFHFLTWFRRGLRQQRPRFEAIRFAYQRCAGAMIHTTIICVAGLLVFVASAFVPTARFARLMAILLVAALAGDLVLLPAILAGPLGRFFAPRYPAQRAPHDGPESTTAS